MISFSHNMQPSRVSKRLELQEIPRSFTKVIGQNQVAGGKVEVPSKSEVAKQLRKEVIGSVITYIRKKGSGYPAGMIQKIQNQKIVVFASKNIMKAVI